MIPQPCQCCKCRGVMCMMFHKGHDHRFDDAEPNFDEVAKILAKAILDKEFGGK